ncbi:uncharacterized protein [Dermacentor albipictus]|uniref:uncharacterized protein n=1 Tax=Dermacentor albipictus TaxID=60249 RepID=UPI0038FC7649
MRRHFSGGPVGRRQIVFESCFIGGGSVGRADGAHLSAKAPLISPTSIVDQGCLRNASAVFGKPSFHLHVDAVYRAPTWSTLTSLRRHRHDGFLGIKEAAAVTAFSGLGGTAVTMLAHVPLYMQVMPMIAAVTQCPALVPSIKSKPLAFAFRQMVDVFLEAVWKTTLMQVSSNAMGCTYWSRCSENGVPASHG